MASYERLVSAMRRYHTAAWICFFRVLLFPIVAILTYHLSHSESAALHLFVAFLTFAMILFQIYIFLTYRDLMRFAFRCVELDTLIYAVVFAGALASLLTTGSVLVRFAGANALPLNVLAGLACFVYGVSMSLFAIRLFQTEPLSPPWNNLIARPLLVAGVGYATVFLVPLAQFFEMIAFAVLGGLFLHAWDELAHARVQFSWSSRWQGYRPGVLETAEPEAETAIDDPIESMSNSA